MRNIQKNRKKVGEENREEDAEEGGRNPDLSTLSLEWRACS